VRVIARHTLTQFAEAHADARAPLVHWYTVAKAATWANPAEVQAAFSKAKVLNGERVRFDISGGDYRLVVAFDFGRQIAFVKFLGTHAQYDRIDALSVSIF
jgi:mRNA interferase HigB